MYKHYSFYVLTAFILSCTGTDENKDDLKLATVGNNTLYLSEIKGVFSTGLSQEDSVQQISKLVESWQKKQLLLDEAQHFSQAELQEIDHKAEEYRNSLIIYEWQKKTIAEKLDTNITASEIEDFYNKNSGDFELKQNIVKAAIIKIAVNSKALTGFKKSVYRMNADALKSFGSLHAEKYTVENDKWVAFEDLIKDTPYSRIVNKTDWLSKNKLAFVQEGMFIYFIKVLDYRLENRISPLSFVKEQIKSIILNKRKMDLLSVYEEELYTKALTEKKIEKL